MHPDDSTPVVRNIHLGPNTRIYIPRESGIPLYTNVLALRLDVRRGCQVALVEQIHKIYSVLPCPSPTSNLLFHSLEVQEFPPSCHKRGYPPLLSPQPLTYFTPLIPCNVQKGSLTTNIVPHHPPGTGKGRAPVFVEYGMLQPTAMVPGGLPKEEDPPEAGHTPGEAPSTILQDIAQNAG